MNYSFDSTGFFGNRSSSVELWETRAAERSGIDPAALKTELTQLWRSTDSGKGFAAVTSAAIRFNFLVPIAGIQHIDSRIATASWSSVASLSWTKETSMAFMDEVTADVPDDRQIHVILDNYCTHKKKS